MIAFIHIFYWTVKEIYTFLRAINLPQVKGCNFEDNYFEESKVKYCDATYDAEIGLKFDPPVYLQRYTAVHEILLNKQWRENIIKVVDFGCSELNFFKYIKNAINVQETLFIDIDEDVLRYNSNRVQPFTADYLSRRKKPLHVEVLQGSIDFPDIKLISVDAVICIEIIEHLYPNTLDALPHNIFYFIEPRIAIFTTPNADFNVLFKNFSGIRHYDHKFEWSRQQFQDWAKNITVRYPKYSVYFVGIGPGPKGNESLGCCSQMAVFVKNNASNIKNDEIRLNLIEKYRQIVFACDDSSIIDLYNLKDCYLDLINIFSHGVCTYESYVNSIYSPYKLISEIDYPFEIDTRSEQEIILEETQYRLYRLGTFSRIFYNSILDRNEIPLYKLTVNHGGEFISIDELRKILEKAGWHIEECKVNDQIIPCVIYENSTDKSESSEHESERSQSLDFNYSTDVNWDSESQWDIDSTSFTEGWNDTLQSNVVMEMGVKHSKSHKLWEETRSPNQIVQDNDNPGSESPVSDPCVSGEQIEHNEEHNGSVEERVELLFDSGYQVSTSSIDLSPDFTKDWLQDEKNDKDITKSKSDLDSIKQTVSDKTYNQNSNDGLKPKDLKSEGQISKIVKQKRNKNKEEPVGQLAQPSVVLNRVPNVILPGQIHPVALIPGGIPVIAEPQQQVVQQDIPAIVENGDLANNNRDREGNNYQAAENVIVNDNAIPRPENLDEHNENHIVLEDNNDLNLNAPNNLLLVEQIGDFHDDEDLNEGIDEASREVQFDQNSEISFSDDFFPFHVQPAPRENIPVLVQEAIAGQSTSTTLSTDVSDLSQDTFRTVTGFPIWLLQMLNISEDPLGILGEDAHFFSQGDGLGIHPSTINIPEEDSTASSESGNSVAMLAITGAPSHPNSVTATLTTSEIDLNFYDALETARAFRVLLNEDESEQGESAFSPAMQNDFAQTESNIDNDLGEQNERENRESENNTNNTNTR